MRSTSGTITSKTDNWRWLHFAASCHGERSERLRHRCHGIDHRQYGQFSREWPGEPYGSPTIPFGSEDQYIWWGDSGPDDPILPGGSADMWFTTAPTTITSGTGVVSSVVGGFGNLITGTIAAPTVPDPHTVWTKSDTGTTNDGRVSLREAVGYTLNHQDKGTDIGFAVSGPITLDPTKGQIVLGVHEQTTEININERQMPRQRSSVTRAAQSITASSRFSRIRP